MGLLLRNPLAFKKKYMLKIYESTMSPSGVVGQACHKAVEVYLKGECQGIPDAISQGLDELNKVPDIAIDFGKTGSREQMLKDYTQGVNFYFAEMPNWDGRKLLLVEAKATEVIHDNDGQEFPLPAKCYTDIVWQSIKEETFAGKKYPKGSIFLEDNKFVRSYTDPEETDPTRVRQAFFNFLIMRAHLAKQDWMEEGVNPAPVAMLFREVKLSLNKDKTPQSQYYVIDFAEIMPELPVFIQLYNDCTKFVTSPTSLYLPNPSDMFDGKDSWLSYRQQLITADAPVIIHKTKEAKFTEKRFIESAPSKVENQHLEPEEKLRLKLQEFGLPVEMQQTFKGSSVILYTAKPSRGVKMSTIEAHAKDIALALKAKSIRVQAPIMGTDLVGFEVPNERRDIVNFMPDGVPDAQLLTPSTMNLPIGLNVYGEAVVRDLREMPHLLVAGATGSGKSVFLNVVLHALTNQMTPEEMQLMLFDPKKVELSQFSEVPHLLAEVITEMDEAQNALVWLNEEMDRRYTTLQKAKCRDIKSYLEKGKKMPYMVVVIDEFADLILGQRIAGRTEKLKSSVKVAAARAGAATAARKAAKAGISFKADVSGIVAPYSAEELIVRLAQKARAVGIHLVIATQRPTVNVVTGLIKANLPARVAFAVASDIDSKVILDQSGAEGLIGKGDMLFSDPSSRDILRLQGFYA